MSLKLPLYDIAGHTIDLSRVRLIGPVYCEGSTRRYAIAIDQDTIYLTDFCSREDLAEYKYNAEKIRNALIDAWATVVSGPLQRAVTTEERRLDPTL